MTFEVGSIVEHVKTRRQGRFTGFALNGDVRVVLVPHVHRVWPRERVTASLTQFAIALTLIKRRERSEFFEGIRAFNQSSRELVLCGRFAEAQELFMASRK